ncbi:MAG: bacteriohemerythrin [gamma proteobacterium symbiont of Bathyaustriella thionipta]|nr:bacteriohemerythrin [gamma proteobacterium symbiont of Bathyaustriella thionipta]
MAKLEWSSDLDTGIHVIDKQHRRIVDYINQLDHAARNHSREEVAAVLDQLVDYTLSHFTFEEGLMEEAGYPFVNAHKKVHKLFVRRVADYQQRFKIGEDISEELLTTLKTWLINHIRNDDDDYVDIVHKNLEHEDPDSGGWMSRKLKSIFG